MYTLVQAWLCLVAYVCTAYMVAIGYIRSNGWLELS